MDHAAVPQAAVPHAAAVPQAVLDRAVLDRALLQRLRDFLGGTGAGAGAGAAWVTGHPGSGMTTAVLGLVEAAGMEAVWVGSLAAKTRAFLRDVCRSPVAINGRRKVLVLDELDVVLGNETAMLDVAWAVKNAGRVPVVCVLKATRAARTHALRKKAAVALDFPPPSVEAVVAAAERVARAEGLDAAGLREVCEAAPPGDLRHVLQTLRAGLGCAGLRRAALQTADAVSTVLGGAGFDEAMRQFWGETGAVSTGVHEAYTQACASTDDAAAYADFASCADLVDEQMHARHRWDLMDLYGCLAVASAAVVLPSARVRLERYGVAWNLDKARCNKAKGMLQLDRRMHTLGRQPLGHEGAAYVRAMVQAALAKPAPARRGALEAVARAAGLDAKSVLAVMRLWGMDHTKYSLNTHNSTARKWLP